MPRRIERTHRQLSRFTGLCHRCYTFVDDGNFTNSTATEHLCTPADFGDPRGELAARNRVIEDRLSLQTRRQPGRSINRLTVPLVLLEDSDAHPSRAAEYARRQMLLGNNGRRAI